MSSLVDSFGRVHTDLRISVTDRCNIRCSYCASSPVLDFLPQSEILSFEEIARFVAVAAGLGIRKLRLTGGEPLLRKELPRLVQMLAATPGIDELAMTTNGTLLARHAAALRAAGVQRLNVSLDTVSTDKFQEVTRRDGLSRVLAGIAAARRAGFERIKLNAVAIRGLTDGEIVPLARFAREYHLELRFIEFMPVHGEGLWSRERVVPSEEILRILAQAVGPLEAVSPSAPRGPAEEYRFVDGGGRIGLVPSVSRPFCGDCHRLRLTADGKLRNCLFSARQWDVRAVLRAGGTTQQLAQLVQAAVTAKKKGRGTDDGQFAPSDRPMYQIGG